jgi:hypothetical protein
MADRTDDSLMLDCVSWRNTVKALLLALIFFAAAIVALHKDPASLVNFGHDYRFRDGVIVSAYRNTAERVEKAVTQGIRFTYDSFSWARGLVD